MKGNKQRFIHNKTGFQGWYLKIQGEDALVIACIIGIQKGSDGTSAFLQIIDTVRKKSQMITYAIDDFYYQANPFFVSLPDCELSDHHFLVNYEDVHIDVEFPHTREFHSSLYAPTIMGPFAYLPFLECVHGIESLYSKVKGKVQLKDKKIDHFCGIGYRESDRGISFPSNYIWFHSMSKEEEVSCVVAIANIPLSSFSFQGIICCVSFVDQQYVFATYYGAKCSKLNTWKAKDCTVYLIELTQRNRRLSLEVHQKDPYPLASPIQGKMAGRVYESLNSIAYIQLYEKEKLVFECRQCLCSFEAFHEKK